MIGTIILFIQKNLRSQISHYQLNRNKMLTRALRYNFGINIMNAFKGIREAVRAPIKHIKAATQSGGMYYSPQTNTTEEAFDQVSHEWQAHVGFNPFDMQTYNYLENAQLQNFGTVDNPVVIFTADAPFRYVGCSGPQNEDDYESHELFWMMVREGPLQRCGVCGQVFKLVRLRNEFSSEMDYYMPNFNKLWYEDMGESDILTNLSITKANTHFQSSMYEQPENTVFSFISSDQHDRILVDPAYRIQKQTEGEQRAKIYLMAMDDYEKDIQSNTNYRHPISKVEYQNLMDTELLIRKYDRNFRKVVKFESRKYVDPVNHARREKRMLERSSKRWDRTYTLYTGDLTEEEQKYRDYFETDLQNYNEDQRLQEFLDKQELLTDLRYNLNKFDFQEGYTSAPEDDQTSYIEKKVFKFKYRRALDSASEYDRRNERMVSRQQERFQHNNYYQLIENYALDPKTYQNQYLDFVAKESLAQYKDYFESEKDQYQDLVLPLYPAQLAANFENWQISIHDKSAFRTFPLPQWNNELGWWANAISLLRQVNTIPQKLDEVEGKSTAELLSSTALVKKNK